MLTEIKDLWRYRGVLYLLTTQTLKIRYRRSVLGFLWTLLNPLFMMGILTLVFSKIMRFSQEDYAIYLFSGMLPWYFLSQSVEQAKDSFIIHQGFIRRIYVPKTIFPIACVASNLVNFILSLVVLFLICMVVFDLPLNMAMLILPISIFVLTIFVCGLTMFFSTISVFFRDFSHLTSVLLMLLFYGSPIIYPVEIMPAAYLPLFKLNPVYHIMALFHQPIYHKMFPDMITILISMGVSVFTLILGYLYLSAVRYTLVYRI